MAANRPHVTSRRGLGSCNNEPRYGAKFPTHLVVGNNERAKTKAAPSVVGLSSTGFSCVYTGYTGWQRDEEGNRVPV